MDSNVVIAVMPVYSYYAQLDLIRKEKSIGSFSIYVCAILLIANILRIFFWLTVGFAANLLFQSIFIIGIMVRLL
jgi:solute carrier family 66, member 2